MVANLRIGAASATDYLRGAFLFLETEVSPALLIIKRQTLQFKFKSVTAHPPKEIGLRTRSLSNNVTHYKFRTLLIHSDAARRQKVATPMLENEMDSS